nr:hypothetical protein [Tanacetum cinerariifolium]
MEEHTKHFISLRELLHMGDLHELFQSLADEDAHAFWHDQESWRIRSWRLYPRAHVHVLETVDRRVVYMFVDVSYPLSEATLERMPRHGLEVPKLLVGGDLTIAEQLVRFIKGDLHELFQSLADEDAHAFWRDQESWRIRSWRLYPRAHVHVLETVDRRVVYMFVDVSYPLSEATLERMPRHGLEVPKLLVGGDLTIVEQLVRFIKVDLLNA